jgi:hypothetical protein
MTVTDPAQLKAPKRVRLESVSSVLDAVLPKGGLTYWVAREERKGVATLARAGEPVDRMTDDEIARAMRDAGIGAEGARNTAARRGINIHALLERYARDGTWADPVGILDVDDYKYAHALNDWLRKHKPEPLEIEQLVADPNAGYAGRLDLIANIDGVRTLVDLKSSERAQVFDRAHAQCRLYHRASMVCGSDPCDRLMVVVVAKDGKHDEMDCLMTDRGIDAALNWRRALKPVTSACDQRNRAQKESRAEPAEPREPKPKVEYVEDDPSTHPGRMARTLRRELPDGGLIEYVESPAGWTSQDATRRSRDYRAYYWTPPTQTTLPVAA